MFAPWPYGLVKSAPPGSPPDYAKGWDDGCKTGLSTMNRQIYKSFYGYKQDHTMADNPNYYKAWKDAYTYCRQYSFRFTWDALDGRKGGGGAISVAPLCVLCPNEIR
tara:strand:- start:1837 stop:2157 length:321 start_codon:yes stop_codon:yes gene_type:complete